MKNLTVIKVSVIIPVWNPGPGISRCIESLRKQTLKEIELIFIDDCGTDDSMDKVRAAATEDKRIQIIYNEKNIGAGPSRNEGINVASGEYISFVDPDDYVSLNFLELLYTKACTNKTDIVKGSIVLEKEDGTHVHRKVKTNQIILDTLSKGAPIFSAFVNEHHSAIYRRDLTLSGLVRYGTSTRGEDSTFLLKAGFEAKSFDTVDSAHYYLCERQSSAMHTVDVTRHDGAQKSIHEQVDFIIRYLPDDTWGEERMRKRFLYYINEADKYEKNTHTDAILTAYAKGLREELLRLPYHKHLAEQSFPIYVLLHHSLLLPDSPNYLAWAGADRGRREVKLAEQWINYYNDNPSERDMCKKDMLNVLARAKVISKKSAFSPFGKECHYDDKDLLHKQIKRLPANIRAQVLVAELRLIMRAVARRALPKRAH